MFHAPHFGRVVPVFENHGTTSAYPAKMNQESGHPYASTTAPAAYEPKKAPKPLVIIIKTPCAEERISRLVSFSTKSEPEMLKKSNATP